MQHFIFSHMYKYKVLCHLKSGNVGLLLLRSMQHTKSTFRLGNDTGYLQNYATIIHVYRFRKKILSVSNVIYQCCKAGSFPVDF